MTIRSFRIAAALCSLGFAMGLSACGNTAPPSAQAAPPPPAPKQASTFETACAGHGTPITFQARKSHEYGTYLTVVEWTVLCGDSTSVRVTDSE